MVFYDEGGLGMMSDYLVLRSRADSYYDGRTTSSIFSIDWSFIVDKVMHFIFVSV